MDLEKHSAACSASDCASCSSCSSCSSCAPQDAGGYNPVLLPMEDGREVPCAILTVFSVETNEYIALLPLEEDGKNHNGEVYLYKFSRTENGDPIMDNIEDDAEYTAAAEKFDEILTNARKAEMANAPLED